MIRLKRSGYENIIQYAQSGLPAEVCGLLGGCADGADCSVTEVYFLHNTDDNCRTHFTMNPKEQIQAAKDMRAKGIRLLGNFHSHPYCPAFPSAEDIRLAYDPSLRYMIISLMEEGHPVVNCFFIRDGIAEPERVWVI